MANPPVELFFGDGKPYPKLFNTREDCMKVLKIQVEEMKDQFKYPFKMECRLVKNAT